MELRTLKRPNFVPPGGGWFYRIEPAGISLSSVQSLDDLVLQVRQYYLTNKLQEPENLRAKIEDYMCGFMPPGTCNGPDTRPMHERPPGFFEVNKALEDRFRGRRVEFCDGETAAKRVKNCIQCSRHDLRLCTGCDGLHESARRFVGGRKTIHDGLTGVCRVYRIPLNALVHVKQPEVRAGLPDNCWVEHA